MRHPAEPPAWPYIHDLEVREDYPAAIDALEARLAADPGDAEAVRRLGFNLWYAVSEEIHMQRGLAVEQYAARFMELYRQYADWLADDADFCWAFGVGMELFWFEFPGATQGEGQRLLQRARELDPLWAGLSEHGTDFSRLKGRGIFQRYYNVA